MFYREGHNDYSMLSVHEYVYTIAFSKVGRLVSPSKPHKPNTVVTYYYSYYY